MELLAPAGNMECLKTAVQSGADAVYFAGKQFGARSFADNFSEEEIRAAAAYCRLHRVKSYLTVNTMTVDREFEELDSFIQVLADAGIDGVIVQDLGVVRRIRQICPGLPIHGSTQMTVHNLAGVRELERCGVSRVVLSRELSRKDMATILENCNAEIEVFVHGAMCMSYSGQCLMSSVLGGRSGNRGKCAQPCRLSYHGENHKDGFYLSLKDMSLISHLEELRDMGVASLKIEGRMKGPEYIKAVVGTYRRCLDEMRKPSREEWERMNRVFFRGGLTDGYFTDKTGPCMFAFDKPDNPYDKNTGEEIPLPQEKKIPATCHVKLTEGALPEITLEAEGQGVTCLGDAPLETAQKGKADIETIRKQLGKTGGTGFVFKKIDVEIEGNPFLPISTVNALRREGIDKLTAAILQEGRKKFQKVPLAIKKQTQNQEMQFTASVYNKEQFEVVRGFPFVKIDVPLHLVEKEPEVYLPEKDRILLNPPVIVPDSQRERVEKALGKLREQGFSGLRAENIGVLPNRGNFQIWSGHRCNLANHLALQEMKELGTEVACLSAELNLAQIRDLQGEIPTEVLGYGHLPLMITENCVLKNIGDCPCTGVGNICDRKGVTFPVVKDADVCRSVILNSLPLFMGDKMEEIKETGVDFCRLFFTIEDGAKCREICKIYFSGGTFAGEYTRLHYYKGVK